jgi:cobalt/nickel transport system permease protein
MHISEGVLSAPVLVSGAALTVVGTAIGLKKLDYDRIPQVAMLAATFFVASLVHVPIGPSSVHLILNGLLGLLLGWIAFPAILVGLILQALLFQFGGFTTLGVNGIIMALPAVACHYLFRGGVRGGNHILSMTASFLSGSWWPSPWSSRENNSWL